MLNKRSEEGIRGRAEAENMSLTYTRSHWAFYGRCLYSCSQVWFHVNEQLPVGSQKSLPDQAPYMCETALDVSEGCPKNFLKELEYLLLIQCWQQVFCSNRNIGI
ncbi:uncharacterized protein LOC104895780 isoform X5 [Beta vulgaris subsp. vulgaris]|uniref:uncharacterized protein LOC104895780 isoform X5 n=1 Tax=Beta vulgaris subsp. vulgaris TaxID=3555 RepID=UPI002549661D|nr:uncharacterized protein LOC104895780 isoform X5 [Beta vulgaris subsp. vulgaris]